jgi:Rrf2 family protein
MKFSTRTRYGLRFLIYLGVNRGARYIQLGEISQAEGVSQKYLEQIIRLLKSSGLLDSARGVSGGYRLAADPETVSLEHLFELLEGDIAPISCLKNDTDSPLCDRIEACPTLPMWKGMEKVIRDYLKTQTLASLIREAEALNCMMMKN